MQTLDELRRLARAGHFAPGHPPVLVLAFAHGGTGSVRQFRTRSEQSSGSVPSLRAVLHERETRFASVAKREHSPYGDFVFVGRSTSSDIVLDDGSISKSHAAFQREGGAWFVKDNRSRNGTYVDGVRLESGGRAPVPSGTQVTFGAIPAYFVESGELLRLATEPPSRTGGRD